MKRHIRHERQGEYDKKVAERATAKVEQEAARRDPDTGGRVRAALASRGPIHAHQAERERQVMGARR